MIVNQLSNAQFSYYSLLSSSETSEREFVFPVNFILEFQTELSPKLPEASLEGLEVVEVLAWWIRSDYVIVEVHEDKED